MDDIKYVVMRALTGVKDIDIAVSELSSTSVALLILTGARTGCLRVFADIVVCTKRPQS